MAIQYFGINRGGQGTGVATGAATTGKQIELSIDLASNVTRQEVLDSLDKLRDFIVNTRVTPFAQ